MQFEGSMRRFAKVDPKGLKTTTKPDAFKAAKQNASLAAKIKTKIQNTSSFFKVSLKTNNKALALALVAQKEKSRLLETETVRLRKEVQDLRFDLALRRHKHNQLVKLLKGLQENALNSIVAAVDLLSAEDDSIGAHEEMNEKSQTDPEDAHTELGSKVSRVAVLSEQVGNSACSSPKKLIRESSGSPIARLGDPLEEIHAQPITATLPKVIGQDTCNEDTETVEESIPPLQEKIACPPIGLQQELDRWSQVYSDIPLDREPIKASLAVVPSPSAVESLPSVTPRMSSTSLKAESPRPERTTLFETEMDITLGDPAAEIVAVETKPKKSRKESVAKLRRKESTQVDDIRPLDKEERKEKKTKSSSVRREEIPSVDAPPTQGRVPMLSPTSCLPLTPAGPAHGEEEEEAGLVERDVGLFAPLRNAHVTSRSVNKRRHGAFSRERNIRKTHVVSLDDECTNASSVVSPEDDYFSSTETYGSGIEEKETALEDPQKHEEGLKWRSRKTYVVSTSQSSSAINRKTYVISDNGEQGRMSSKSRRTKALLRVDNEPAVDGPCVSYPSGTEEQAVDETIVLRHGGLGLAGKRKGPFTEAPHAPSRGPTRNPDGIDDPIMEGNPPCEASVNPPSAVTGEPKPKRSRKESGTRVGKERKQKDSTCSQVKKRKKTISTSQTEKDLDANVPTSWEHNENSGSAPSSHAGPDPGKLSTEHQEDWGIALASVTSHRKNIMRKTNIISLGECEGGCSVDVIVSAQPFECPAVDENAGLINTVTLCHASALDSNFEENKENNAYSGTTEARGGVIMQNTILERNVTVSQEEADPIIRQTCPVANRKTSMVSDRHSRDPVSAEDQSGNGSQLEKKVLPLEVPAAPSSSDGMRQSLKKLILEERPPWELLDDTCTSFPEWDVSLQTPAPSSLSKRTPARVAVYEEQSNPAPECSPVGRALKSLTNTAVAMDPEHGRVRRRGKGAVSYKEPSINCKMRRGDKFSDTKFLSSPIFKEKKKKKLPSKKLEAPSGHCFKDLD